MAVDVSQAPGSAAAGAAAAAEPAEPAAAAAESSAFVAAQAAAAAAGPAPAAAVARSSPRKADSSPHRPEAGFFLRKNEVNCHKLELLLLVTAHYY